MRTHDVPHIGEAFLDEDLAAARAVAPADLPDSLGVVHGPSGARELRAALSRKRGQLQVFSGPERGAVAQRSLWGSRLQFGAERRHAVRSAVVAVWDHPKREVWLGRAGKGDQPITDAMGWCVDATRECS